MKAQELIDMLSQFPDREVKINTGASGVVDIASLSIMFPETVIYLESEDANDDYDRC